jgi:hypothetical protein
MSLENLLANLNGANRAHILEALTTPQSLTATNNARFAPIYNRPSCPRLVFPEENPALSLVPNGWRACDVGPWRVASAPLDDPEENEYNRMLRVLPIGFGRDWAVDADEDQEQQNENDEIEDEEEGGEVFSNGGSPWAPEMEEEDFCEGDGEDDADYDPENLFEKLQEKQLAVCNVLAH